MKHAVIYLHGRGGDASEAEHYRALFPDADVIGWNYLSGTPWEAEREFFTYFAAQKREYDRVTLIANSIGAHYAMYAPIGFMIDRAYFISPVVDMEALILWMMAQAGVREDELREKKEIALPSGEILSWQYLCYIREHPIEWRVPTHILCGANDALTSTATVSAFAKRIGATLDIFARGEHWFHTKEQMAFLDEKIGQYERTVDK